MTRAEIHALRREYFRSVDHTQQIVLECEQRAATSARLAMLADERAIQRSIRTKLAEAGVKLKE